MPAWCWKVKARCADKLDYYINWLDLFIEKFSISAVGSQSFTSKDMGDIRNDYLQKQSELQPIKPQLPF